MRRFFFLLITALPILLLVQCQQDNITLTPVTPSETEDGNGNQGNQEFQGSIIHVNSDITSNVTWASGNVYILDSLITVSNGATLTIESCVVVKAANGATGLVIDRGAKLDAQGNATCPIIFTSLADSILPGTVLSPNMGASDNGLWAGVIILGEAPVSSWSSPTMIELLPTAPIYGGQAATDNSGSLSYVSIRHAGYEMVQDQPGCGLVLAGVGSGTTIDHVELYSNADDGMVILGGTVDINNVVTSSFQDDGFDLNKGYAGTMDNLIGIGGTDGNSSLELDGGSGANNPSFTIKNSSFKGSQLGEDYIDFQGNVNCVIESSYFFGFDAVSEVILQRDRDADNWLAGLIDVLNLEINVSHLSSGNTTVGTIFVDKGLNGNDAFVNRAPSVSLVTTPSVGASKASFAGWTVADASGALNDF
ncbi:MAG: hypothetical protein MRZ79_27475 [Bacteroidia bacterium]|nr:hypothetical protein [Bacteroidia bacterium]